MTVSILEAKDFQCRFIEGSDDQCCGKRTERGSWCPEHRLIVFKTMIPLQQLKQAAE